MLINNWYVVGTSEDLEPGQTRQLRALGNDFVLFRDSAGAVHCLSDICIHRGGSLGRGDLVGDAMQCPYHGWRFNGEGRCVEIPSIGPEATIPKRARVDSYPTAEKWGWIWVFFGDLAEGERPELPGDDFFPEYGGDEYKLIRGTFMFDVNWMRAIDNVLDPAHPFHVHGDFGHIESQEIKRFPVEEKGLITESNHSFKSTPKQGAWREKMADERPDTINRLQFHLSGLVLRNDIRPNPGMHHFVFSAYLPIEENKVLNIWMHARNFFQDEKYDADTIKRTLTVFEEDARVLNHVAPLKSPRRPTDELLVEADAHIAAFRKQVRAAEARGWAIDTKALAADDEYARVIPSPARTADPKNWVLDSVPCRPVAAPAKAAE